MKQWWNKIINMISNVTRTLILPLVWAVFITEVIFLMVNNKIVEDGNSSILVTSFVGLIITSYFNLVKQSADTESAKGAAKIYLTNTNIVSLENVGKTELKIISTKSCADLYDREEINNLQNVFSELDNIINNISSDILSAGTSLAPGETIVIPIMQTREVAIELVELKVQLIEVVYETLGKRIRARFYVQYSTDPDSVGILHFYQGRPIEPFDFSVPGRREELKSIDSEIPNNCYNILSIKRDKIR